MGSENFLREGRELLATLGLGELLSPMGLGRTALGKIRGAGQELGP